MEDKLFASGEFFLGCNYWASHAGTNMWREWDAKAVEGDFARLAAANVRVLRVFPLWPDFQPLVMLYGGGGREREIRLGEDPLPDTEEGRAGMSPEALAHFDEFVALAEKYHLRFIVGLVTGWMSGRLYVPKLLEGRNVLNDPLALKWEIKFVKYFVKRYRDCPAIAAWDLGNECNCMAPLAASEEAYLWAQTITMAIRTEDAERPVVSGMHGLSPEGVWRMQDQGEICDVLCTHPYPIFTPHCDTDPLNRMKSALHAAAESNFYEGIGGKPCFAEEAGTLGPLLASEEIAADYARAAIWTLWAHDCRGFMWWCANEQIHLTHAPYDWNAVERELGLFHVDGTPKAVVGELTKFAAFVEGLPFAKLPARTVDAVCVLTRGQDAWAAAYGACILAKQAGAELVYRFADQPLPEAKAYLLPSLKGDASLSRRAMAEILSRVEAGATLVLSLDDALLSPFSAFTGLRSLTRERRAETERVSFAGAEYAFTEGVKLTLEPVTAEVLAQNAEGQPFFTENRYGKGRVFLINAPIEYLAATRPGATDGKNAVPYYRFYAAMGLAQGRAAHIDNPTVGCTEHVFADGSRALVLINYEPFAQTVRVDLAEGYALESGSVEVTLPHNGGGLLRLVKKA